MSCTVSEIYLQVASIIPAAIFINLFMTLSLATTTATRDRAEQWSMYIILIYTSVESNCEKFSDN